MGVREKWRWRREGGGGGGREEEGGGREEEGGGREERESKQMVYSASESRAVTSVENKGTVQDRTEQDRTEECRTGQDRAYERCSDITFLKTVG